MNIKEEYLKLVNVEMNIHNFKHFVGVAKEISKHYPESRKQVKVYNEQYQFEQAFMILFYHKYANMFNKMKTSAEIVKNVKTSNFLTPAHYNPVDKKISYKLDVIMREKSTNFANVMELCLHENRYAMQFKSFSIDNADGMLDFDPNSIFILKDYLVMQNRNYRTNHINSLMEIDANLYTRGMSKLLITQYFSEHQEDLKNTDIAFKEKITDNPFDEISEYGLILGEYILGTGEKIDRAIMMDKNLKGMISSKLVEQYPMLKLIWKDGNFKTYSEIMEDKKILLQRMSSKQSETLESPNYNTETLTEKEKVERLYSAIIQIDPMLYLESLLSQDQLQYIKIKELFSLHPTLLNEYQSQITELFSRKSTELHNSQMNFFKRLSKELNVNKQSTRTKNIPMNEFVKNALNNGVQQQTVEEVDEEFDLNEFIEFIDPELINEPRFLELLKKYRILDMPPEEYVECVEEQYKRQIEITDIEPVEEIEYKIF